MTTLLLLLMGIILIFTNYKVIVKEKKSFTGTFKETSDKLSDNDLEIGELRHEFGEVVFELQQEIEKIKAELADLTKNKQYINKVILETLENNKKDILDVLEQDNEEEFEEIETFKIEPQEKGDEVEAAKYNNEKLNEIEKMINEGLSIDSISEKLGIGKGEVLLIQKLYLK